MATTLEFLSNFLEIEMGQSPEAIFVNKNNIGLPLLNGPAEFAEYYPLPVQYTTNAKRFAKKGDILFCVRGSTTGRMNIADREYAIGRGLAAIRHKKGPHLNSFVKALLDLNLNGLLGGTLGSVFPNLTKDRLFDYKCAIPDILSQEKISSILSHLETKIHCNNKLNDNLFYGFNQS
jgi:type I restriction enzyme S subunit